MALLKTVLLLSACVFSANSRKLTPEEKVASEFYEKECQIMYNSLLSREVYYCKDACKFQSLALMDNDGSMNKELILLLDKGLENEINKCISEETDKTIEELEKENTGKKHYRERFICEFGQNIQKKCGNKLVALLLQ